MPMRLSQRHERYLAVPLGIPLRKEDNRRAGAPNREQAGVDQIIFGPERAHGTGEGEHALAPMGILRRVETIIVRGLGAKPFAAGGQRAVDPGVQKPSRLWVIGAPADVLQAPIKRQHSPVVIYRPAAMLVATDFLFEPGHEEEGIE